MELHVLLTIPCGTSRKKVELDSLKIVEAFAFRICQNAQKVKVKKYRVEKSLIRYLNDTEIYIWPDK